MGDIEIPAPMAEAAAIALCEADRGPGSWRWRSETVQNAFRWQAKTALAAALGVCEVREDFGARTEWLEGPGDADWRGSRPDAEGVANARRAAGAEATIVRRLVLTAPAEEVAP